jgi:hypothetical protein
MTKDNRAFPALLVEVGAGLAAYSRTRLQIFLRECEEAITARQAPPEDYAELKNLAIAAYKCYEEWVGPPADPKCPCEIRAGYQKGYAYCAYNRLIRRYVISIPNSTTNPNERLKMVAHEMYHRVTWRGRTTATSGRLGGQIWVEEMMANLASHRFLCEQGYAAHIERLEYHCRMQPGRFGARELRAVKREPRWFGSSDPLYPPGFQTDIIHLGMKLSRLLTWEDLCRLPKADTLEDWIVTLPEEVRASVRHILDVPCA